MSVGRRSLSSGGRVDDLVAAASQDANTVNELKEEAQHLLREWTDMHEEQRDLLDKVVNNEKNVLQSSLIVWLAKGLSSVTNS